MAEAGSLETNFNNYPLYPTWRAVHGLPVPTLKWDSIWRRVIWKQGPGKGQQRNWAIFDLTAGNWVKISERLLQD